MSDNLKAWCHWKKKEVDTSKDDLDMVKDIDALFARISELEAERDAWKSAAHEAGLRTYDGLVQENAKLRKVVNVARDHDEPKTYGLACDICEALRELDGEKKCRHVVSDPVGITNRCRSCGEMC